MEASAQDELDCGRRKLDEVPEQHLESDDGRQSRDQPLDGQSVLTTAADAFSLANQSKQ